MTYYPSDYGYDSGAVSMRCIACGSYELNCCNGDGRRYTHRIINEDGQFMGGFYCREDAAEVLLMLRTDRDTAHNYYEMREV
jgi:hypothetical protein